MTTSRIAFALVTAALTMASASAVMAQTAGDTETVLTASPAASLPTPAQVAKAKADAKAKASLAAKPITVQEQILAWSADAPPVEHAGNAPAGGAMWFDDDKSNSHQIQDGQIHGEMGVSVGTNGYRSGYISSVIPLGHNGTLAIAYGQTNYGKSNYGNTYSGRHGGYGWGRRVGNSQSLALSLDLSDDSLNKSDNCNSSFHDSGRYSEPMWTAQRRDDDDCKTAAQP